MELPFMRILSIVLTLLLLTVSSIYATELPENSRGVAASVFMYAL